MSTELKIKVILGHFARLNRMPKDVNIFETKFSNVFLECFFSLINADIENDN